MVSARRIKNHLERALPSFSPILRQLGQEPLLQPVNSPVPQAVVRVIVGQMLSRQAATQIYSRVHLKAEQAAEGKVWLLSRRQLRECGLSERKAVTIVQFAKSYVRKPQEYDNWRNLEWPELRTSVDRFHGMSDWTAAMLGIFYFAQPDIFPTTDGSIRRALSLLQLKTPGVSFPISEATPFRSYAAIYLWKALDRGALD